MLLSKAKLIKALKVRRAALVANHSKRVKGYSKQVEKYRLESLRGLASLDRAIRRAKTCREIKGLGYDVSFADRDYPKPPHRVAPTAGVDKIILELQLLDESVVTVESSRNYLDALRGEYDNEKEYDDDEDDEE